MGVGLCCFQWPRQVHSAQTSSMQEVAWDLGLIVLQYMANIYRGESRADTDCRRKGEPGLSPSCDIWGL